MKRQNIHRWERD